MKKDSSRVLASMVYPLLLILIMWLIKIVETIWDLSFVTLGIYPLRISGLIGIIFSPLIHSGYSHLLSNTFPLLILGTALFYFYKDLALRITVFSWLITGLWVWVFARESYHIGASGLVYSWAAFLFVSGIIRNHPRLMALSLLVTFIYGSMVWGIFPLREQVSWEGHLMGMISGVVLALFFRQTGPQRKKYSWELEEEHDDEENPDEPPYWMGTNSNSTQEIADKNQ